MLGHLAIQQRHLAINSTTTTTTTTPYVAVPAELIPRFNEHIARQPDTVDEMGSTQCRSISGYLLTMPWSFTLNERPQDMAGDGEREFSNLDEDLYDIQS